MTVSSVPLVCDFCGNPDAVAIHDVRPSQVKNSLFHEAHTWAACAACHDYITRGDQSRHGMHCLQRQAAYLGVSPPLVERMVMPAIRLFWHRRTGTFRLVQRAAQNGPAQVDRPDTP